MIELPEIAVNAGSPPSDMRYPYEYVERHGKACAEAARAAAIEECAALTEAHAGMRGTGAWVALTAAADRIRQQLGQHNAMYPAKPAT